MSEQYEIKVLNDEETLEVEAGRVLLEVLLENDYRVPSLCGGMGLCGKCRVKVLENPSEPVKSEEKFFSPEELNGGMRLSCRVKVDSEWPWSYHL